jgi:hypothetical protein
MGQISAGHEIAWLDSPLVPRLTTSRGRAAPTYQQIVER